MGKLTREDEIALKRDQIRRLKDEIESLKTAISEEESIADWEKATEGKHPSEWPPFPKTIDYFIYSHNGIIVGDVERMARLISYALSREVKE